MQHVRTFLAIIGGFVAVWLTLAQISSTRSAAAAGGGQSPRNELSAKVDELFRQWHSPDSPGAAVLVMSGGDVVHARGYGMANLEWSVPNTPAAHRRSWLAVDGFALCCRSSATRSPSSSRSSPC